MNKFNTLKLTSITASAALLLSVVFSGSAIAGPGQKKGPQASIGVTNICFIQANNLTDAQLKVVTTLVDKSSGVAEATITSFNIQALEKNKGRDADPIGDPQLSVPVFDDDGVIEVVSYLPLCDNGLIYEGLHPDFAKSVNAETTVMITDGHKVEGWISRCVDDPETDDVVESQLKVLHLGLCPQNAP